MRDEINNCKEKYPYFLSFIEESFMGVTDRTFGRVEVYTNKKTKEYVIDELRFSFKENQQINKEFRKFREKWDFKNVSKKELESVARTIKNNFVL